MSFNRRASSNCGLVPTLSKLLPRRHRLLSGWMPMGTLAAEKRREVHARDAYSSVASPPSTAGASAAKRAAARTSPSASPSSVSSSLAPAAAASLVMPVAKSRLTLERVIGMTSLSNAMMAVNPVTGEIAYSAGCIVVIYNLRRNKQVRYYRVEKSVACLCFSPNGQYLAIGEKGYSPAITIWDGTDGTLCAELQQHKYGVACMAFSRDGRYLLSAGLVHDQHMYAWDLTKDVGTGEMKGKAIGAAQIQEKVLSMDYCQEGNFFVSVGEKHFKFWFLDDRDGFLLTGYAINDIPEMQHRNAVMSTKAEATFTSVACGYGACRLKTFAVTSDGTLCCFGASCIMERLVSLEAAHGNAISVTEAYVAVAGSSSIVRLFDPSTLEYRSTMPFPPPFGKGNEPNEVSSNILHPDVPHRYPAVIAVRVTGSHVIVLYSDRSLFVYDVSDTQNVQVERSFMCHSGCIRDLQIAGRVRGLNAKGKLVYHSDALVEGRRVNPKTDFVPNGTFVTCSDDNTMRLWHLDLHKQTKSSNRFSGHENPEGTDFPAWKNPFSQEMLRVVYHDQENEFADEEGLVLGGTCSCDRVPDIHSPSEDRGPVNGLRAVAIRPDQTEIVAGDKEGNVIILQAPHMDDAREIGAHNTEVHCIAYSGPDTDGFASRKASLMASGGRDRLVHVYDCNKGHTVLSTLENHSGAVTSLLFTRDGKKLLSSGADKNVVFSEVRPDGKVTRYNSVSFTGGKIFDMAVTSDDEFLVTSCNNRLDIHAVNSCKQVKSHHVGEQHRIDICPANFCVAMSGSLSDKTIHVVDLSTGETLADATGHGEAITALKFTPDCRRLVSTSSDGCVFVWRLSEEIQNAIKSRLPRVTEFQAPNPIPPPKAETVVVQQPLVLPPPAPPIAAAKTSRALQQSSVATDSKVRTPQDLQISKPSHSKKVPEVPGDSAIPAAKSGIPKKSEPKEAKKWKSKATAVPGPMAKIPMEEWMRTRESARTTVHIADDDGFEYETSEEGVHLEIDRSQTPDWAKTVKPKGAHKAERTSPSQIEARRLGAGEKWGKRAAPQPFARANANEIQSDANYGDSIRQDQELDNRGEDVHDTEDQLYKKQQSSKVHQLEGAQQRPSAAPENVMSLSIANLDINSHNPNLTSSSLALEREQLEKRKKQIDTANAVAAMNNRLSQLGLLKLQTPQQVIAQEEDGSTNITQNSEQNVGDIASVSDDASTHDESEELMPKVEATYHGSVEKDQKGRITRPDIPEEMLQSIDISVIRRVTEIPDEPTSIIQDRPCEGARSAGENNFDMQKPTVTDSVASLCAVDQSMSTFTQGFAVKNVQSTTSSIIDDVDRSLSAFSSGYTDGVASKTPAVAQLVNVASSLSAYTQGHMGKDETKESISRNVGVAESLSSFTTGYQAQNNGRRGQDSREPRVDESLSAFTSGFQVVSMADQSDKVMQRKDATSASMSLFTSGYSSEHASQEIQANQSISLSSVTASLSQFTSGYNTDNSFTAKACIQSSTNNSRRQSATESAVAASFSMFTTGYEADGRPIAEQNATPAKETKTPAVMESLSVFTTGYEIDANQVESPQQSNSTVIGGSNVPQQTKFEHGNNASDGSSSIGVGRSLSSFTAGYEVMNALPVSPVSSPCSVVSSTSSSTPSHARETSEAKPSSVDARCPEATVQATMSDLDQQLVTVAKAFEDFLPTEKVAAPEVQEIQQLVTQLRAAIEKFSGSEN